MSSNEEGFSIIELLVVVVVTTILSTFAILTLRHNQVMSIDNQAKKIIDVLDEARQNALNQRQTMRVEINKTRQRIRIIDENSPSTAADDVEVRTSLITNDIEVGIVPNNISATPNTTSPIPIAVYQTSNYPLSSGEEKITLRFKRNGQVADSGTDDIGTGSFVSGASIYLSTKKLFNTANTNTTNIAKPAMVRIVSVLGSSSGTALLKCIMDSSGNCSSWSK